MPPLCLDPQDMDLEQGAWPSLMDMVPFTFRFTCLLEMMHPFFLIILLGLPWVHTTVNNTSGLGNSTSGLDMVIKPRQGKYDLKTPSVLDGRKLHLELNRVIRRLVWDWAHQNQVA